MDWQLGMTQELAGMVQILHVERWELIQGGWEEKNDQTEKLGSSEYIGFLLSQAVSSLSRTSPSHPPMHFLTFKTVGAASKMCLQHFQK